MFDVGPPTLVTGIVTKGRGDSRKQWVTRFRISYSNDTSIWYFYKDASHLDAKVSFSRDYYPMLIAKRTFICTVCNSICPHHKISKYTKEN